MCLMLCLYIHVRVLIHDIVLILPLSAVVYQQVPAHFTINNDILMRMSPDQADRMFLVFKVYHKNILITTLITKNKWVTG